MNRTPEPRNREERIAQMRERFNEVVTHPQHRRQIEEDLSRSRHDILAVNGEHRVPYDQSWKDAVIKFKETQRFGLDLLKLQVTAMRSNDARDLGKYFGPVNALRDVPPEIEDMHGIYNTTNNVMKSKYPYPLEKFYHEPIEWVPEVFEPRIQDLLDTGNLSNMDHCMLRLRSYEARDHGDARFLMQFLKMVLPELFDEKLMAEIEKEISQ